MEASVKVLLTLSGQANDADVVAYQQVAHPRLNAERTSASHGYPKIISTSCAWRLRSDPATDAIMYLIMDGY